MKNWKKLGKIFSPEPLDQFLQTHASNPMPIHKEKNIYRVFYSGRDKKNRSSIGWVDIDIEKKIIIKKCKEAIFKFSSTKDSFYSHGVSIGNYYKFNNKIFILFMGWQIREGAHWRGDIGQLVVSSDLEKIVLSSNNPYMTSDKEDQLSLSYPFIINDDGLYKMWYGSTESWDSPNNEMIHVIKYAESTDLLNWSKKGTVLPWSLGIAQAFSRPTVIKHLNKYHMWFSYRKGGGDKYKIGYSSSDDGKEWSNELGNGLPTSKNGWDSEMVCYPFVFKHKNNFYMLYNGNKFGRDGFGLAILEG
tara:strand:- start:238 stop:1146 length:909 start_codon:yes stop_codon:yes gene_type:complete